jgi:hypothetical protein
VSGHQNFILSDAIRFQGMMMSEGHELMFSNISHMSLRGKETSFYSILSGSNSLGTKSPNKVFSRQIFAR